MGNRARRASTVVVCLVLGCGGSEPRVAPVSIAPPPPPPPDTPATKIESPPPEAAPPALPPSVEPTVLGDAERARDATFEPIARASIDAYPNWNGLFTSLVATWSPDGKRIVFGSQ